MPFIMWSLSPLRKETTFAPYPLVPMQLILLSTDEVVRKPSAVRKEP